jgi:ribosomal protein S18 acetylase RimI-like enzyme
LEERDPPSVSKMRVWQAYKSLVRSLLGSAFRSLQGTAAYRRLANRFRPGFTIMAAEALDLKKLQAAGLADEHGPEVTIYVACGKQHILGFVYLVRHPPESFPYSGHYFYDLHVHPLWRRLGLGELLLQRVIDQCRLEKAPALFGLVFEDNRPALNLYGKLGFQRAVQPGLEAQLEEERRRFGRRRVLLRKALS